MAEERTIEALFEERRTFPPPSGFAGDANVREPDIYARAAADPEAFWAE